MNLKLSKFKRSKTVYLIIAQNFGRWISPLFTGLVINLLFLKVSIFMFLDFLIFKGVRNGKINSPIVVVGNPRSGTTFMHRYLVKHSFGVGTKLYQLLFPSVILQFILKPFIPILEKVSPTKHHSTDAHKTSLNSIETDDASLLFRYLDGFFLYGFFLSWSNDNLFDWVDPKKRDTSSRDFNWFESIWLRSQISNGSDRVVGKLFSVSANVPTFLNRFPSAKLIYMVRDPLSVIPSGLSLVTGVLDKKFGFWSLPDERKKHFINNLYKALVQLQIRFHDDWKNNKFDKSKVMIVRFDKMMINFESVMDDIMRFTEYKKNDQIMKDITMTANQQRKYKSKHKYDLEKFGLTQTQIKNDCKSIYDSFLS